MHYQNGDCTQLPPHQFSYLLLLFSDHTYKTMSETTKSNPLGPIKLSSQSTASAGFVLHFYQPLHLAEKCGAKTIVQSQTGMFWLCSSNFLLHGNVSSTLKLFLTFRFFFICVLLLYSCSSASSPYEGFLLRSFFSFSFFFLLFCFLPLLFDFSFSFSLKCNEVAELIIGKENTLPIVDHNNTIIH